uniref:beta-galactosidase domain 4-containing protein n=1 Tax=Candidatus Ventrimonas sp. TaxID=3048889 RepID=UPI003FF090AB
MGYGGDFTDRPTDYNFCGNGIVYGNRTPSPKAAEAKALYQNLKLTPEAGQVLVKNENLFTDTSDREFVYRILKNGNQVYETRFDAVVKEGEEKRVPVDLPEEFRNLQAVSRSLTGDRAVQDEYVYQVSALLKEDTLWAEKGFETDFGETLESEASGLVSCPGKAGREELSIKSEEIPLTAKEEPLTVIHGDVNLGVKGRGFSVLFSRTEGGIVSLRYGEKEWIARAPMPTYWRASTDNDRGNHFAADSAAWMAADQFCRYDNTRIQIEESENQVTVTYRYGVLVHPETETRVTYTVGADGKIQTSVHFCGKTGLPQLPLFGMRFRLLPDADRFSYYGYGPEESYPDRKHGVRLGIFYGTPEGNMASYLIPQECGNRSGVRWMKVLDSQGNGLKFTAAGRPLDMNVLPYTALELEQALHEEELPVSHNTIVTVLGAQRGVGGDDSWGAPVHRAYEISGEKDIDFHFVIEGCRE